MRARELAEPFPVVHLDTDAMEATRLLVDQALPGLVVVDHDGLPLFILPGSQGLRFALPDYVEEDRALASVYSESDADALCESLRGHTVQEPGARVAISCAFTHTVGPDPFGGRVERIDIG